MRVPPFALNGLGIERGHDANVDVRGTLIEREMSPRMGRRERRVRSRGLPRKRGLARTCGIMTVVIRRLLVVSGAGERPAKSSLTSPVFTLPDGSPLWSAVARLASECSTKQAHGD